MAESESDVMVVLSTIPAEDGPRVARFLVDERLCACVNLVPNVTSFFNWKGEIVENEEQLAIVKTTRGKLDALLARLDELHPYDVPEALVLPIAKGLPPYLAWVVAEVNAPRAEE